MSGRGCPAGGEGRIRIVPGFTLIELVVALAVSSIVVLAAHAAMGAIRDHGARASVAAQRVAGGAMVRRTLEGWIWSAARIEGADTFIATTSYAGGVPSGRLQFGVTDAGPLYPGPHRIRIWLDRDPLSARRGVIAEVVPLDARGLARPETLTVVEEADGFEVRLLRRDPNAWVTEWRSAERLPIAIELRMVDLSRRRLGAPDRPDLSPLLSRPIAAPVGVESW